jgi:chloramphenicol-sensitive protein RarD
LGPVSSVPTRFALAATAKAAHKLCKKACAMMTEAGKGVVAMTCAACVWGLSPVFYKWLAHVPALDVLSHRMLWSLVFFGIVLGVQNRLGEVRQAINSPRALAIFAVASVTIAANWALFIWSVQVGQTTQTSLGYYIYPLVAVLIGRVIFAERLARAQWVAVSLAAVAVTLLTYGLGAAPWVALTLATTFGLYGLIKKQLDIGPVVSVTVEVLLLAPIAAVILLQTYHSGGAVLGGDLRTTALLVFSGPLTAVPLILFSYAARRLAMATVGLLQYINPTLQFGCAVFLFGEAFGGWHMAAFGLIWTALAIYSVSRFGQDRARRKASRAAAASGTIV